MQHITKILRILLLVLLIVACLWLGYIVSLWVFDILDFQLAIYEKIIGTTEYMGNTKDTILGFFGAENGGDVDEDIYVKLNLFKQKLLIISRGVGILVSGLCWYIGSSVVFGFSRLYKNVKEFVG